MRFCIRDDDTSFFTTPEDLERAYGDTARWGPVSLAIVPFCRAGTSKGVPERFRHRWSVHPLHQNRTLVEYLRERISEGRFEAMLHGFHHDEPNGVHEFAGAPDLHTKVADGRKYLEDVLGTRIRVFVPPHNSIGPEGLRAIAAAGLHLAGTAGLRAGWSPLSLRSWGVWLRLRQRGMLGRPGIPWVLDLGDHRELPGNAVTPSARLAANEAAFDNALAVGGVFCLATHYWEHSVPSIHPGEPTVIEHIRQLCDRALVDARVRWLTVGDVVAETITA